ncbi:hypothetical protein [Streptomyces sp. NBC_01500]|uniref:hypothetical protein n=1 Tax=Streptomyces sp. NBC_01500 TaxID=2903886 RepID=UPI0022533D84|nr:hypothetical protein [Streptomyces sp. NBC_01500]MCX4554180.1 hypothetical protein [Streptomyces sp. NBC_01500]MCX4554520.1 hypothetical protein [Streptomyces sp. NBC_01500]
MALYKLTNGHRIRTRGVADGMTEFETRNPEGETISTVTLPLEEAAPVVAMLRVNDGLRSIREFGGGARTISQSV